MEGRVRAYAELRIASAVSSVSLACETVVDKIPLSWNVGRLLQFTFLRFYYYRSIC